MNQQKLKRPASLLLIVALSLTAIFSCSNPKAQKNATPDSSNVLHVIPVDKENWYVYFATGLDSGAYFQPIEFELYVTEKNTRKAGKLIVQVKPTEQGGAKAVVDILDILTKNKISRYSLGELSISEKQKLKVVQLTHEPPGVITNPSPTEQSSAEYRPVFRIEIRSDNTIWYQLVSKTSRMAPQKVDKPVTENLVKIIADYKQANEKENLQYLIMGHPNSEYSAFNQVVEALKKNNIFEYKLSTSEENEN